MSRCHIITGPGLDGSQNNLLKPMSHCDVFVADIWDTGYHLSLGEWGHHWMIIRWEIMNKWNEKRLENVTPFFIQTAVCELWLCRQVEQLGKETGWKQRPCIWQGLCLFQHPGNLRQEFYTLNRVSLYLCNGLCLEQVSDTKPIYHCFVMTSSGYWLVSTFYH